MEELIKELRSRIEETVRQFATEKRLDTETINYEGSRYEDLENGWGISLTGTDDESYYIGVSVELLES